MTARFFAPLAEKPGDRVTLPDDEAQHLTRVLRLKAGAAVRVFNGRGHEFDAIVENAAKSGVELLVGQWRQPIGREPQVAVTLAQAVLKGEKMDDVVRDAVMLGAAAVQPIVTARSEVTLASLQRSRRVERWSRIAVSSAKQCGRATVPPILEPRLFDEIVGAITSLKLPAPGLMFVEPSALPPAGGSHSGEGGSYSALGDLDGTPPREATVVIGPEGGWDPQEIVRGAAACRLVTLRSPTLRADAMPLVALTALFTLWREL
jgi:16S rRNA (uracil1498-N3)-methyltransferase